jgi:hypothetical protein
VLDRDESSVHAVPGMNEISEPSAPGRYENRVPGVPGRDERSVPGVPQSSLPLAPDRDGRSLPGVQYCRDESSMAGVVRTRYLVCNVGIKIQCARWSSALGVSGEENSVSCGTNRLEVCPMCQIGFCAECPLC